MNKQKLIHCLTVIAQQIDDVIAAVKKYPEHPMTASEVLLKRAYANCKEGLFILEQLDEVPLSHPGVKCNGLSASDESIERGALARLNKVREHLNAPPLSLQVFRNLFSYAEYIEEMKAAIAAMKEGK